MTLMHLTTHPSLKASLLRCATAAVLAVGLMLPAPALQAYGEEATGGGASPAAEADLTETSLTIKAGAAVDQGGNKWKFPYLTVESSTERKIRSITVQFTSAIVPGVDRIDIEISSEWAAKGFTLFTPTKEGNRSVNNANGATAAEWQEFLRQNLSITLADSTTTKSLRMIANFEPVKTLYDYNSFNGHYYETVTSSASITWQNALAAAKNKTYMGMQGYLVTITSEQEDKYVGSMIKADCWMAATCLNDYTSQVKDIYKDFYASKSITIPANTYVNSTAGPAYYFWVDGPEKGQLMSYGNYKSHQAAPNPERLSDPEASEYMYVNWNDGEPNNSQGEQCAHILGATGTGKWNDYSYSNTSVKTYVIEYGGMPGDPEDGEDESTSGGSSDADVFVKVEVNVDPTGRTITTSADNVRLGQPLKISENANGGDIMKTDATGEQVPSEVVRTFYKKEEDGTWTKLDEPPTTVGTYKVESNAVFRDAGDSVEAEDYKPGSAQFKILPAVLDVTTESDTPSLDEPSQPGQPAVDRHYTKVYDGTTNFTTQIVGLEDLLLPGFPDAKLVYDYATFASAEVGERDLVLHNVRIDGADAASYTLAGMKADPDHEGQKTLTVRGTILPREVVLTPALLGADGSSVTQWQVDKPITGQTKPTNDLADFDEATGNPTKTENTNPTTGEKTSWVTGWNANMLAPDDALAEVLAGITIDYSLATKGGLALNETKPQIGTYLVNAALKGEGVTYDPDTNSYLVGNYRFTIGESTLKVNPKPDPTVIETTVTTDPTDPGSGPVTEDDILDIVKGEVSPGGKDPSKPAVPDVKPTITITEGKTVIDEIDPTEPGEYVVTVTYPDPDGGPDTEVVIHYVVEPPAPAAPETTYCSITTRLRGSVDATTTLTPSASVKKGDSYKVTWFAGKDRYVSLVEVDGKPYDAKNSTIDFSDISTNHEVVVTVVKMPSAGSTVTPGWYTVTVNRYGGSEGLAASPTRTVDAGDSVNVWWQPEEGYEVTEVVIDGKQHLTAEEIAKGSIDFAAVSANHVVDVRYKAIGHESDVSQLDYLVNTKIEGGPGSITGGATVAPGGSYEVAWDPVVQTTSDPSDPNYAVYEVASVTVNGDERAGARDDTLELSDIKSDQDVVITMRPALFHVNVTGFSIGRGSGKVSENKTLFKGQQYAGILGTPDAGSRIARVVVDGAVVYDETDPSTRLEEEAAEAVMDDIVPMAFALTRATAPTFPPEVKVARAMTEQTARYDISGIAGDHKVEVYFAKEDEPPVDDDTAKKAKDDATTVTPTIDGGSGTITIGTKDPADPDAEPEWGGQPDPDKETVVKWDDVPEGSEPTKIVVNGEEITLTPEDIEKGYVVIPPDKLKPGEDNTVELIVERKPLPGDDVRPTQKDKPTNANDGRYWVVSTGITGGAGTVTPSAEVIAGDSYTVTWAPAAGYRVAKVLVDGMERPDLLEAGSVTFDRLSTNHSVQVLFEEVPEQSNPDGSGSSGNNPNDGSGGGASGSGSDKGGNGGSGEDTGSNGQDAGDKQKATRLMRLAQTGDTAIALGLTVFSVGVVGLAGAFFAARKRREE